MVRRIILLVGLVILLFSSNLVLAGGWVVVSVDALPEEVRVGDPLELSFRVR